LVGVSALITPGRPTIGSPCSSRTLARLFAATISSHALLLNLHQPRLQAVEKAVVTNDVRAGFLYATLTEMTGNIWLMRR